MAQQKLYTEEQVKTIIGKAQMLNWDDKFLFSEDYLISSETPIELPSDEEILKESDEFELNSRVSLGMHISFEIGAKWMRDKILNK